MKKIISSEIVVPVLVVGVVLTIYIILFSQVSTPSRNKTIDAKEVVKKSNLKKITTIANNQENKSEKIVTNASSQANNQKSKPEKITVIASSQKSKPKKIVAIAKRQKDKEELLLGEKLYTTLGCKACHSTSGKVVIGPTWKGLYKRKVEFTDNTFAIANDDYIEESILFPDKKIVKGFNNLMPSYSHLTKREVSSLVEYIEYLDEEYDEEDDDDDDDDD